MILVIYIFNSQIIEKGNQIFIVLTVTTLKLDLAVTN